MKIESLVAWKIAKANPKTSHQVNLVRQSMSFSEFKLIWPTLS